MIESRRRRHRSHLDTKPLWPRKISRRAPPVIYAIENETNVKLIWRLTKPREDRVIYNRRKSRAFLAMPGDMGFLPSPDGQHILIWETRVTRRTAEPLATRWQILRLADETLIELGQVSGEPRLLPYWLDAQRVMLYGDRRSVVFDLTRESRAKILPLSDRPGDDLAAYRALSRERLRQYCAQHHPLEKALVQATLARLDDQVELADYYQPDKCPDEPKEYLLLRGKGVPGLGELRPWWPRIHPYLAVSPDGQFVAVTYLWKHAAPMVYLSQEDALLAGAGAQLRIFKTDSLDLVWEMKWPFRLRRSHPHWLLTNPPSFPWTSPNFQDLRWSADGKYLSFTVYDEPGPCIAVIDATKWEELLILPEAMNVFVMPQEIVER